MSTVYLSAVYPARQRRQNRGTGPADVRRWLEYALRAPERLLVFDVADGWDPLCAFLDLPVPERPFPHLNEAKVTRRVVATVRWGTRAAPVLGAAALAGLAGVIASKARR